MESSFTCHLLDERFANETTKEKLLRQSSCFNIDVNLRLMLLSEQLVETLITSGVGRYLEFAAIERTYVHFQPSVSGTQQLEKDLKLDTVWEVPCFKKDVFQSKLLNTVEKRQLMNFFLQSVADYREMHVLHEDVKTKNKRMLALGRALKRPQNKINQVDGDTMIAVYVERPFQELLENTSSFPLNYNGGRILRRACDFPATKNQTSARDGLAAVYRSVPSIGTAFLAPLYSISELVQNFCRLYAVYGGTYVLCAPLMDSC
ncbi:unnamed protein product [Peronospora belbahrii]|uniref:Uncharacterized protein n=1 Tax=Peronospora belbahrii TaxID=622444 RepID=A0ABN8D4A9_9STRA|nr:unnamed protein product [Peronospora belbahrii]